MKGLIAMNKTDELTKEEYETWVYCFARACNDIRCAKILMASNQYTYHQFDNNFFVKLIPSFLREALILIDKATQYKVFEYQPNDRVNEILKLLEKEEYTNILRFDRNNLLHYVEAKDDALQTQFLTLTPIIKGYSTAAKNLDSDAGVRYIWAENISYIHRFSKHNMSFNSPTVPEMFAKYTSVLNNVSALIIELCTLVVDSYNKE